MSPDRTPSRGPPAARARPAASRGGRWSARAAALAGALLLSQAPLLPAQSPSVLDVDRTILALRALQEDPELAPLHLGVRVRNGVAELFGPVPSAALARRAVARLQDLPALTGVRNNLFSDPFGSDLSSLRMPTDPRLPGRTDEARNLDWQAPGGSGPAPPSRRTPSTPTARSAPRPGGGETSLTVPSIAVPIPVPDSASPAVSTEPREDIAQAVRRLQRGQERFRRVRVTVQADHVILSGAVPAWRDLHELSQAITRIPGVAGVTLREVRTDPPR